MNGEPYNPLDKFNLARSIEGELLRTAPRPLGDCTNVNGAGVYAIYYSGDLTSYEALAAANRGGRFTAPIYVGKAIPKGGRKGGLSADSSKGRALADRLGQHAQSIREASNLDIDEFHFRHLVVDDVWIPLGENMLIESFKPVWNRAIDGFGNKDPGNRRATQYRSPWDTLHPGRHFADKLASSGADARFFAKRVTDYLAGRPLDPLPKHLASQILIEAQNAADEADSV